MEGKIVFEGTTNKGLPILIRYARRGDAEKMWKFINEVSQEESFIAMQKDEISLEDEQKWLDSSLKKVEKNQTVYLLAFSGDELIGSSDSNLNPPHRSALKHEATFGIVVAKEYRGKGVGKLLMQCVLDEAVKNLPGLQIVTLGVFSSNDIAIEMYKKFGFQEFGRLPEGVFRRGRHEDHIYMYKKIR